MFVKSNVTKSKIKLPWTPITEVTPSMFEMMFTASVRAIEVFRVEKGMVLTMVVGALAGVGVEQREKRTKTAEPVMKRTVRLAAVMWK